MIAVVVTAAVLAPWVTPHDPHEQFFDGLTLQGAPLPPNERFWLGTDLLGRDLYTRVVYGARTSLIIGIVANAVAVLIGTLFGTVAGYVGASGDHISFAVTCTESNPRQSSGCGAVVIRSLSS